MFKRTVQIATFVLAMCVAFTTGQAQSPSNGQGFDARPVMDTLSGTVDGLEVALQFFDGDTSDPLFLEGLDRVEGLINAVNYLTDWQTVSAFEPCLQVIAGYRNQGPLQSYITIGLIINVLRGSIASVEASGVIPRPFIRGDSNSDTVVDISDVSDQLGYLFLGDEKPGCLKAADMNDDGSVDVADPVETLSILFVVGSPDPRFGSCDTDQTRDSLSCEVSSCR